MKADLFSSLMSQKINQTSDVHEKAFESSSSINKSPSEPQKTSFYEMLQNSIEQTNSVQKTADRAASDLATGKTENIHETMLAFSQAELSFNLMVQVRNKILESYQDVMRMQV